MLPVESEAAVCGMQAPLPARSPLSEMQLPPVVLQPQPTPQNLDKGSPSTVTVLQLLSPGQTPTAETCLSPQLRFRATPGSTGEQLRRAPKQGARGAARKAPTPKTAGAKRAAHFNAGRAASDAGKHGVPDVEASLCNLHGSPLSPPDLTAADKARGLPATSTLAGQSTASRDQGCVDEALQSTAASPFQAAAGAPPFGANLDSRLDPLPEDGSPLASPALLEGASTPRARGARPRVPSLNLSGSLRISVEATTPPCSFPLRGHAAEAVTDRRLSACSARSLSSDDEDGRFLVQATYEHARPLDNAHAARIGTSKLAEPGKQEVGNAGGWGPLYDGQRREAEDSDGERETDCMPTARSTEQALYELGKQETAQSGTILGETSTFLAARAHPKEELIKAVTNNNEHNKREDKQQEAAAPKSTPSKAQVCACRTM